MPELISNESKARAKRLHEARPAYGTGGGSGAANIVQLCRANGLKVILDYGCGKGHFKRAVAELAPDLEVLEFDPAVDGKDVLPGRTPELVVAFNVLEHVEYDFILPTLGAIWDLKPKAVCFHVHLVVVPDMCEMPPLIVQPAKWWQLKFKRYFAATHLANDGKDLLYIGTPHPESLFAKG